MTWSGHFHGFGPWIGTADAYHNDGDRRPPHPDPPPPAEDGDTKAEKLYQRYREVAASFPTSTLPPLMTGHWLIKGTRAAPERTWTDAKSAVEWLTHHYNENPPFEREDGKQAYVSLDAMQEYALDALPIGLDVSWVHYTRSGSLLSLQVVCCPNRFHPQLDCPLPPT